MVPLRGRPKRGLIAGGIACWLNHRLGLLHSSGMLKTRIRQLSQRSLSGLSVSQPTQGRRCCANPGLYDCNPVGDLCKSRPSAPKSREGLVKVARRFIAGYRSKSETRPGGTVEFCLWECPSSVPPGRCALRPQNPAMNCRATFNHSYGMIGSRTFAEVSSSPGHPKGKRPAQGPAPATYWLLAGAAPAFTSTSGLRRITWFDFRTSFSGGGVMVEPPQKTRHGPDRQASRVAGEHKLEALA